MRNARNTRNTRKGCSCRLLTGGRLSHARCGADDPICAYAEHTLARTGHMPTVTPWGEIEGDETALSEALAG